MIQTIVDTIIWLAEERMEAEGKDRPMNINSAIHSVTMDVDLKLMDFMSRNNDRRESGRDCS